MKLFTIGHSNHTIEKFFGLLDENSIMVLIDVRSTPYSRYNPQFNKESLKSAFDRHNMEYFYAGKYLGGRPADPSCYKSGVLPMDGADYLHEVNYPVVMKRPWFIKGIAALLDLADQDITAIMCSEEDPAECHRHHLIAKYLMSEHPEVKVYHIRGDGNVYSARSIMTSVDNPTVEQKTFDLGI